MPQDRPKFIRFALFITYFERACFYVMAMNGVSIHYCSNFEQLASGLQRSSTNCNDRSSQTFRAGLSQNRQKGMSVYAVGKRTFSGFEIGQEYWDFKEKENLFPQV